MSQAPRLWFVHHANQYLLTEGYRNRDGLSAIVQGYAAALQLHERYAIPCGLHLSGTLIEAMAWGSPWFFPLVRKLVASGVVTLIGGTYSENLLPLADPENNRRQLAEYFRIFGRHLGEPGDLEWFWVPERLWSSEQIRPVIQDRGLPNGGYHGIFLDRRHLLQTAQGAGELLRGEADRLGPWHGREETLRTRLEKLSRSQRDAWLETFQLHALGGEASLQIAPICEFLRYWIPAQNGDRERLLDLAAFARTAGLEAPTLVFADDFERTAGVAGWDPGGLARYQELLAWVRERPEFVPAPLALAAVPKRLETVAPGSFYELEHGLLGGEQAQAWAATAEGARALRFLARAREAIESLGGTGEPRLTELAWKHLLASQYETIWHERDPARDGPRMAPWAEALASHSRHALVMVAAARWFAGGPAAGAAELCDLDEDGAEEVVLKGEGIFAVLSPRHGGRLVSLFCRGPAGGAMMVGNPADDWNWQCELNQYMQVPANHPGAFCDLGGEDDRHDVIELRVEGDSARVTFVNREAGSVWHGTRKTFHLGEAGRLSVAYELPIARKGEITVSLSPDYLELLRQGGGECRVECGPLEFAVSNGPFSARVRAPKGGQFCAGGGIGHGWTSSLLFNGLRVEMELECSPR